MPKVNLALGLFSVLALTTMLTACATGGGAGNVKGNDNGSEPINDQEKFEYQKAIVRCYKTGGSRVVKIMGELRCY
jgi:hypothetical protein